MSEGKISVVFQPIMNVETGRPFAFEALARCAVKDLAYPPRLFELAVEQQVCGSLGRAVRELATEHCAAHALFLNVHPLELSDRWLVQPDDPIFTHEAGVYLEITESVPLSHRGLVDDILREVRSKGIGIVVDDLGAGYSNLRYIADLEPHIVKLDRGLIEGLDTDPRRRILVASLVKLCRDLGSEVVAEGIETRAEFDAVRDAGVKYVQGYLIARPALPAPFPADCFFNGNAPPSKKLSGALRALKRSPRGSPSGRLR